ncbi:MAG: hypothetical protein ABII23_09455 [bacterium]
MKDFIKTALAGYLLISSSFCLSDELVPDSMRYFPLTIGTTWEYHTYTKDNKESFMMKVIVEEPEEYKGKIYHILTQKDTRGQMRSFLEITEESINVKKTGVKKSFTPEVSAVHEPALPLFPFNLEKDHTFHWEGRLKIAFVNKDIILDGRIIGEEEIEVPAGRFTCIKIHFHQKRGEEITDEYAWYAPGAGQVKYIGSTYIKELSKFIPAAPAEN